MLRRGQGGQREGKRRKGTHTQTHTHTDRQTHTHTHSLSLSLSFPQDNVGLFTVLEHVHTHRQLFVANLHLTWDPNYSDVKVVQVVMALKAIKDYMTEHNLDG